jgi:hypothetical protein
LTEAVIKLGTRPVALESRHRLKQLTQLATYESTAKCALLTGPIGFKQKLRQSLDLKGFNLTKQDQQQSKKSSYDL